GSPPHPGTNSIVAATAITHPPVRIPPPPFSPLKGQCSRNNGNPNATTWRGRPVIGAADPASPGKQSPLPPTESSPVALLPENVSRLAHPAICSYNVLAEIIEPVPIYLPRAGPLPGPSVFPNSMTEKHTFIRVRGAREHNLKG